MSIPVLTFFNNKGGVGKTTLVYHLSWMFAEMGLRIVAVDLDPQANLTAALLDEDQIEPLWANQDTPTSIYSAIKPLSAVGDLREPVLSPITRGLDLVPGDVALSSFEETLSGEWPKAMGDSALYRPFRILTSYWLVSQMAGRSAEADLILIDVGPNLGAINRSALIATDFVVIPLGAALFSLKGLQNLGPTFHSWRTQWRRRFENWGKPEFELPAGTMRPVGYVIQQHSVRLSRPVKAYDRWVNRMPGVYHQSVLGEIGQEMTPDRDPACLATLKHYRSLIPLAQEARKPVFKLTPGDGAIGSHAAAVRDAYSDFRRLATCILERMGLVQLLPQSGASDSPMSGESCTP
jgi:cellulose biosynthesis protein BcsQ